MKFRWLGLLVFIANLVLIGLIPCKVLADHIRSGEVYVLRLPLGQSAGYLNFQSDGGSGAEYTGHTDGFETARDGGRDWSDHFVSVKVNTVESVVGTDPTDAGLGDIEVDFDFARKIYAQAGLSVRTEGFGNVTTGSYPFSSEELEQMATLGRSPAADTINLYYLKEYEHPGEGLTVDPATSAGGSFASVRDGRARATVAHELGHMLLDGPVIHQQDPGDPFHSTDIANLMFATADGDPTDLIDVGPEVDGIGGKAILTGPQVATIHSNPGLNNPGFVNHFSNVDTHGDRVDFDWVTDHRPIEQITLVEDSSHGADLNEGTDFLVWEINPPDVAASAHIGPNGDTHNHGGMTGIEMPAYTGTGFHTIDVFSNINRYADNDVQPGAIGDPLATRRVKALDYQTPEFSVDGIDWQTGTLHNVFVPGWTGAAVQDDFVARFTTDLEARFVRIAAKALDSNNHDGNAQIDAILASASRPVRLSPSQFDPVVSEIQGPGPEKIIIGSGPIGGQDYSQITRISLEQAGDPITAPIVMDVLARDSNPGVDRVELMLDLNVASIGGAGELQPVTVLVVGVETQSPDGQPGALNADAIVGLATDGRSFDVQYGVVSPSTGLTTDYYLRGQVPNLVTVLNASLLPPPPGVDSPGKFFLGMALQTADTAPIFSAEAEGIETGPLLTLTLAGAEPVAVPEPSVVVLALLAVCLHSTPVSIVRIKEN